jgi:hypothetical protein
MQAYKVAVKIDHSGELHLSEIPFQAGEEVEVVIRRRESESANHAVDLDLDLETLPPVTRSLLGVARGADEEDYRRYLEEKHR